MARSTDVTEILVQATRGNRDASDRLHEVLYGELRRLAQSQLRHERPDHTLQATALVHEAYLRLVDQTRVEWQNRSHFLAVAAQAIRRVLIDHARKSKRAKRGGDAQRITLEEWSASGDPGTDSPLDVVDLVALDGALRRLAAEHPRPARVVEMRFFGGLTNAEVADLIGVSLRTIEGDWRFARAWLFDALDDEHPPS